MCVCVCVCLVTVGGSPYTADPKEISMEEETETPLETLQIQANLSRLCMWYTYNKTFVNYGRFQVRVVILVMVC